MRHLLTKDMRLVAPHLWLIVPVHALYSIQALLNPELYFWMNLAAALAWTGAITAIEWHFDADHLVGSLPVSRAQIVAARYASALGGLLVGAALFVLYGHVTIALPAGRVADLWRGSPCWGSVDGVVAFLAVGYAVIVGFLPFFFRWGLPLGASFFAVAGVVALTAGTFVARVASRAAPAAQALTGPAAIQSWSDTVRGWILAASAAWGPWVAGAMLVVGAGVFGAASLGLSIRLYQRREL